MSQHAHWFSVPTWFLHHLRVAIASLGRMSRTPLSLLTICVIGVALALPATFLVFLNNVRTVYHGFDGSTRISLYLNSEISGGEIDALLKTLRSRDDIADVRYISKEEGLAEFAKHSGFADVLAHLPENPLPPVIEVYPSGLLQASAVETLFADLQPLPDVVEAKLDLQWLRRLQGMVSLGQRAILAWLVLFFAAVVLVIGNTIRMLIANARSEIEVVKLVGGTNAFIRRPFLHIGLQFGVFGGITAIFLVAILVQVLAGPVAHLAKLYDSGFLLTGLSVKQAVGILLISGLLGLLGAWLAVQRQLFAFEPG